MLIAKCEECGYVERVSDNYAGCDLECPCGRTVHVPSKFKVKATPVAPRQVYRQQLPTTSTSTQRRFGRLEYFLHILASFGVGLVVTMLFGMSINLFTLISCVGNSVWQGIVTQKRLDDCGFNQVHIVPIVATSVLGLLNMLFYPATSNSPFLGLLFIVFGLWGLGVFVACLFQPGKMGKEVA